MFLADAELERYRRDHPPLPKPIDFGPRSGWTGGLNCWEAEHIADRDASGRYIVDLSWLRKGIGPEGAE
jgi:hypothetical protein